MEATEEGLVLTVFDAAVSQDRCAIATLDLTQNDGTKATLAAQITMDGMYQIADNYPPGTELDPVSLS